MTNTSPLPKKIKDLKPVNEEGYKFEILFNGNAELINLTHPSDMSLEKVNNHLAVAMLYLAQKIVEKEGG